jgi:Co/Zn/Cd efflux system component
MYVRIKESDMSAHCCHDVPVAAQDPKYRRALWIALAVNAAMFGIELGGGLRAGSAALLADAVDFFGDAANYGVSLFVLSLGALWRGRAALLKGWCMAAFGVFVLVHAASSIASGTPPEPATMGLIGALALVANLAVALLLYAYRNGDANMRSVWLCTRNDAIGNVAVLLAAAGVFGTGSGWPDWGVAVMMGSLALSAAYSVIRHARAEIAAVHVHVHGH